MTSRPWTMGEVKRALALDAAGLTAARVGEILGRTPCAIGHILRHRRAEKRPHRRLTDHADDVRRLHAEGHTDAEIGRRLGLPYYTAYDFRHRLGLSCNIEARRAASTKNFTNHNRRLGVAARWARWRAEGLCEGWPGLRPWDARAMTQLWLAQEATARELASRLGIDSITARHRLLTLERAGWTMRSGGRGIKGDPARFRVADGVEPCQTALPRLLAMREGRLEGVS